jgi:hypothetical protein
MAYVPPADGFGDWATPKLLTAGPFFALVGRSSSFLQAFRALLLSFPLLGLRESRTANRPSA